MIADWKDEMFVKYASDFADVLTSRPARISVSKILGERQSIRCAALDIGCGTGRLLSSLAEHCSIVVGLDYSFPLLSIAARGSRHLSNVVLIQGDVRCLSGHFPSHQFDFICRAYTSIGYFPYDVERSILAQCAEISADCGVLLLDTFNQAWFEKCGTVSRRSSHDSLDLVETYNWNPRTLSVDCRWRYIHEDGATVDIPFSIEGYDAGRISTLLNVSGWELYAYLNDIVRCDPIDVDSCPERLVVLAKRKS